MRYENALYFSINCRHCATNPPPLGAAGFGTAIVHRWENALGALGKIFCRQLVGVLMTGIRWPAEYKFVVLMAGVGQDLENLAEDHQAADRNIGAVGKEGEVEQSSSRVFCPSWPRVPCSGHNSQQGQGHQWRG